MAFAFRTHQAAKRAQVVLGRNLLAITPCVERIQMTGERELSARTLFRSLFDQTFLTVIAKQPAIDRMKHIVPAHPVGGLWIHRMWLALKMETKALSGVRAKSE